MREEFDDYIGASPQSSINIDEIAQRGRTVRRRRRVGAVCMAGLGLVAVAALSVPFLPTASSQTPESTPVGAASVTESDRLLTALKAAITREAPGVTGLESLTLDRNCLDENANPRPQRLIDDPCTYPGGPSGERGGRGYLWKGKLTVPSGTFEVELRIGRIVGPDSTWSPEQKGEKERRAYIEKVGALGYEAPNGDWIIAREGRLTAIKTDGTGVMFRASKVGVDKSTPHVPEPPFTDKQLAGIGLDAALKL